MQEPNPILQVTNLVKRFAQKKHFWSNEKEYFTAVNDVTFTMHEGEILGLLGTNGAGKTTTIQMLLSLMVPTSGEIKYFGKDFFKNRSQILQHVSFASTYVKLPSRLTVLENLDIYAHLYGLTGKKKSENIEYYLKFFGMWHLKDKEARYLSAGEMTRAILAKAFMAEPKIVLLDEPTASLDPDVAHDVRKFVLKEQAERKVSILFTSHNMDEVAEVCDRVMVLKKGKIIADATPEELAASVAVARLELVISEGLEAFEEYLNQRQIFYNLERCRVFVEIDEQRIASLLLEIGRLGITYSYISIDKPTLEDYFLHISKQNHKNGA